MGRLPGPPGPPGPQGVAGPQGLTGATGEPGLPSGGSIIPYASGVPIVMSTVLGDVAGTAGLVGFGVAVPNVTVLGGAIDLTGTVLGPLLNVAFSVPRDGIISSISAFFSTTAALALLAGTVTVTAQLYSAPATSNTFTPITGTAVALAPPLTGVVALGTISSGSLTGLAIPVTAGTRLLLVFTADATGLDVATLVTGYASAGVGIL